jgi:type IV pilus assembly protein PilA
MKTQRQNYQRGFTLIELMIVIAIIGILTSIAIPAYQDFIAKSQVSEALLLIDGLKSSVTSSYMQEAQCLDNSAGADLSVSLAADIHGKYVARVETGGIASASGGCTITAIMKTADVSVPIQGAKIRLTMITLTSNSISWQCIANVTQQYVPLVCSYGSF